MKSSIPCFNRFIAVYCINNFYGPTIGFGVSVRSSAYFCKVHNSRTDRHRDSMLASNGKTLDLYMCLPIFSTSFDLLSIAHAPILNFTVHAISREWVGLETRCFAHIEALDIAF